MKSIVAVGSAILLTLSASAAESPLVRLSIEDVVGKALRTSGHFAAARAEVTVANLRADGRFSHFFPKLIFEATGKYVTEVPELQLGNKRVPFGDNESYSVGPVLRWTVWDSGENYNAWRSLGAAQNQKIQEAKSTEIRTRLMAQQVYFQVLLASAQMSSVAESLALAKSQYRDIENKKKSGAASRADALQANREILGFESRYLQAQSDLAQALRELFAFTGEGEIHNLAHPINSRMNTSVEGEPSLIIETDPLEKIFTLFDQKGLLEKSPALNHPKIAHLTFQSESLREAADSAGSGHWPKLQVFAKSSLDYPNGPNADQIHQNTFGATLTWSIFEAGRVMYEVEEKQVLAQASDRKAEQAQVDLVRDFKKAQEQIANLRAQQKVHQSSVEVSKEIAEMIYSSYKAGRSNFLDVQSANQRVLDAKIQAARTHVQILLQLAHLATLVEEG